MANNCVPDWIEDILKDLPPILTKNEAAEVLRLSPRTVQRKMKSGALRFVNTDGASGRSLIPRLAIGEYLASLAQNQRNGY